MIHRLIRTLRNRQEPQKNNAISVSTAGVVVDITDRKIDRVVFNISRPYRHRGFVATSYHGNKKCAVCLRIFGDEVLDMLSACMMIIR